VFEVLAYHKNLLTRLISGHMILDGSGFPIKRGVAKVEKNKVMVIIEEVR
jgi:F0F1-type ATP synthase epsilon subunit